MQEQQLATIVASFQTELYNRTSRISVSIRFLANQWAGHVTSATSKHVKNMINSSRNPCTHGHVSGLWQHQSIHKMLEWRVWE